MENWIFDEISSGRYQGINDSGIETFGANVVKSLTREVIQNSLDAKKDKSRPVKVTFTTNKIKPQDIPGYEEQLQILKLCVQESISRKDKKAIKVFKDMVKYYTMHNINVLVISDYNTTGLTEIGSRTGSFESLIKSEGYSYKDSSSSAGSFGIGKNAAFSASKFRTVFYNSLNEEREKGFQGVTILTSHKKPNSDKYRLAKGFFPLEPITTDHDYFKGLINRTQVGTDIIIVGFESKNFDKECIDEVVNSYFMSFEKEKLEVEVNGHVINKNSYGKIINDNFHNMSLGIKKLNKSEKLDYERTYQFYQAIKENVFIKKVKIGDIEDSIEIYAKTSNDSTLVREVIGVRNSGMSINSFKRFAKVGNYAGVVYIESEEINEVLQSMENPSHNMWEPDRHMISKNEGTKVIYELRRAIREVLETVQQEEDSEEELLVGLNDLFNSNEVQTTSKKIRLRQKIKRKKSMNNQFDDDLAFSIIEKTYGGLTPSEKNKIDLSKKFVHMDDKKLNRTFYNVQNNKYKLLFSPKNAGNYFVEFLMVSVDDKKPFVLNQIKTIGSQVKITQESSNGLICYGLEANTEYEIEIESQKKYRAVIEVNIYEVKK